MGELITAVIEEFLTWSASKRVRFGRAVATLLLIAFIAFLIYLTAKYS